MYDELVKKIRHCATDPMRCLSCGEDKDGRCFKRLMTQAADAIEELSKQLDDMNEANIALYGALPRWIPVTERLPSVGDKVIVAIRDESGDTRYDYTNTGWYSGNGHKWVVEDEYCSWVTHWMPLPEPPKEE